jgi:hypothetical protein
MHTQNKKQILPVNQDKRKVKCSTCKHANLIVAQPVICHLHEYTGSPEMTIALRDKVDFFFGYDLSRMTLMAVTSHMESHPLKSFTPVCSSLSDSVGGRSDYPLEHLMFLASQDFHGKYGEFVVASRDDANDVKQVTRSNYQDTEMEINRVEYLRDGRSIMREGSWFYDEPSGSIISRGYDSEGGSSGGGASSDGSENGPCPTPGTQNKILTFVVYHVSHSNPL